MVITHNLGFPRIGAKRELKFQLESYWQGKTTQHQLHELARSLRQSHWQHQATLDFIPVGDFSFYDQVLDCSFLLGNVPERIANSSGTRLDRYFRLARGRAPGDGDNFNLTAGEMTKWFDSNYHYIVPELESNTAFTLNAEPLLSQIVEAKQTGNQLKPVIIGPLTYLWLGRHKYQCNSLDLLNKILPVYSQLLEILAEQGIEWVQLDEPILVTELDADWQHAFSNAYTQLNTAKINILLASYFGQLQNNLRLACELPVQGLHIDAINAKDEINRVIDWLPSHKVLSLGLIDGRNIWKTDLNAILDWLEPLKQRLQNPLWLAPSCSLLHVPVNLDSETRIDPEIRNWLAFATQKLDELQILKKALNQGRTSVQQELAANLTAIESRQQSKAVHQDAVKERAANTSVEAYNRQSAHAKRAIIQQQRLNLPLFPTTTIGSFPQTLEIRQARKQFKNGELTNSQYQQILKQQIQNCINNQEALDLDVLVHGEAERNDMVEYFGEQLSGFIFSDYGWVQSYGSRCVKPPILYGDVERPKAMTVDWISHAQSLTEKPVKGMLTGPVTILNWSFVRDDQSRSQTCKQLALAIRDEVLDLEKAGIAIIQIDEAALREGLPLRASQYQDYLKWAVECFRLTANGVKDETQIHTHMCYSQFNDIIEAIAAMDADVITIETSRSDRNLLQALKRFDYPNQMGPGVYDIHSPNTPDIESIVNHIRQVANSIKIEKIWINPDCGLKTRTWEEVTPALQNMVEAANRLRQQINDNQHAQLGNTGTDN